MSDETNKRDIEIQESLDANVPLHSDTDVTGYRRLFKALATVEAGLPTSFAYNVMVKVVEARLAASQSTATLVSLSLSFLALIGGIGSILVLSALGYTDTASWATIVALLSLPAPAFYVAATGLFGLALIDLAVNRRARIDT